MTTRMLLLLSLALALAVTLQGELATAFDVDSAHVEEVFEFDGDSHWDFGRQLGERFRDKIQTRLRRNAKLQTLLLPYARTAPGRALLDKYLTVHKSVFPRYVEELEGMAEGSDVPFETLFVENLVEELSNSIPSSFQAHVFPVAARQPVLRCSDVVLTSKHTHVVAHNEDSGAADVNRTAIVIARIGDQPKFVAYTYVGDLPSGAFGFNANGVAFTLNYVEPAETFVGGLGRGFISRDLLTARDAADAIAIVTRAGQAAGHNFQLMDVPARRVWNVEVASFDRHVVHEYVYDEAEPDAVAAYFHANQYQRLQVPQPPYQSSLHRLRRYRELTPPTTIPEALAVLGDQQDRAWPVFHDARSHERGDLSGWTLASVLFDLERGQALSFHGNPARRVPKFVWDLTQLTVTPAAADHPLAGR